MNIGIFKIMVNITYFLIIYQYFYVPEYVDFWFDTIHCHRTIEPRVNESSIDHIDPPVILVLTGKDKYKKVII